MSESIYTAKRKFNSKLLAGEKQICPICNKHAQIYRRKITGSMAYVLVFLYSKNFWIDVYEHLRKLDARIHRDFTILRFWGLIKRKDIKARDGNPKSGLYKITEFGREFVSGNISVPKYICLYNDGLIKTEGESVFIEDVLDEKFNYSELMEGVSGRNN